MASSGNGAGGGQIPTTQSIGGLGSPLPSATGIQQGMNPLQQQQSGVMPPQQKVGRGRGRPPGGGNVYAHQQMPSMQQQMQRLHANASQLANQMATNPMATSQSPHLQQPRLVSQMSAAGVPAVRYSSPAAGVQYMPQQGLRPIVPPMQQQVRGRGQAASIQGVRPITPRPQQQMQRVQGAPVPRASAPGYPQQQQPPQQQQQQQQWVRPQAVQQQQAAAGAGAQGARVLTPQQQQFLLQQQQARAQQRPGTPAPQQPEANSRILGKRSIQELVAQVDSRERLDPEVEDALMEIADDFIESVTSFACALAKHRNSTVLEAKDVLFHLERNWDLTLPGFGNEYKVHKKPMLSEPHKQRLAVVKKS